MFKLNDFIRGFISRGGIEVLFSSFGTKVVALALSVFVARELEPKEFGSISYALMIITPLIPVSGLGMDLVLIRYGALIGPASDKLKLLRYTLKKGLLYSFVSMFIVMLFADLVAIDEPSSAFFIRLLSSLLVFDFLIRIIQSYLRILEKNRLYALIGIIRSLSMLIITIPMVYSLEGVGYGVSMLVSAALVALIFSSVISPTWRLKGKDKVFDVYRSKDMHKYGAFIGVGAVLSQLQVPLNGVILGILTDDSTALAVFKVASVIPVSLLFLPNFFFKSEFVHITKNTSDKNMISSYILSYLKLSGTFCILLCFVCGLLGDFIITALFGVQYADAASLFFILIVGVCGGVLLRQPFGNITFASGRPDINVGVAVLSIIIGSIITFILVSLYGVKGAAFSTAIIYWLSGLLNASFYYQFIYKKL